MFKKKDKNINISEKPTGISVIVRELKKDKIAMSSLIILGVLFVTVFVGSMIINQDEVMKISLLDKYAAPGEGFWLGADTGGRDILGQLIIGARNSIIVGVAVTILTSGIGIVVGLIAGYYGGMIDNIIMRLVDFLTILPRLMLIIVFVTVVPKYNLVTFIFIMSIFYWTGIARLIRSKVLTESRRDYVQASKTMGTSDFTILFRLILSNISSIIIVDSTLNLA